MRKRLLIVLLVVIAVLSFALGLTGCNSEVQYGKSAYDLYKELYIQENGSEEGLLSLSDWLLSLKGEIGEQGLQGNQGIKGEQGEQGESGEDGKSAYELYVEAYVKAIGSNEGVLTEEEWLNSLRGEQGEPGVDGKSAYELYVEAYIKAIGSDEGVLTEEEWLSSLRGEQGESGEDGKSAYELYVEAYIKAIGSDEGVLSENEWLESLHGVKGTGIDRVEIVCGDIIIYYDNNTSATLNDMLPEAGHSWDEGVTTTNPTCITPGVITYTCNDCGATKKELTDANNEHRWGEYAYNDKYHWQTCKICGDVEKHEHYFGDNISKDNVDTVLECECGIHKTAGEVFSYKVAFECGHGASVLVYETQDYTLEGLASTVAYSRDGVTGELLNNGDGQVNFEVILELGYKLKSVSISPKNYKNLKEPSETGKENTFRITKITGELIVSIETEIDFLELPVMVINTENSAPIKDKENYVNCQVSVMNAEDEYCFESVGAGIRGRGNTSWGLPKKPYKLKFDNKVDLFGNGEAKKWTLIANYADLSLIRNYIAYTIGAELEGLKDTTTSVQFIELFLNGQYEGVYLICEQNEAGSTRVDIDEDLQEENGEINVNTGYLLETDNAYYEGVENQDYFIVEGKYFQIKSPDTEENYFIENKDEYINFVKTKIQGAYDALRSDNTSENYENVKDIIDVESFLDGYFIDELMNLVDREYSSFYIFYDNEDGKIHRGPIWDYDASIGNCAYSPDACEANALYANNISWYGLLLNFDGFRDSLKQRLEELSSEDKFLNFLNEQDIKISSFSCSFERNFVRWNIIGQNRPELEHWNTEEIAEIDTWRGQVEYVLNWLEESFNFIKSVYCS